MRAYSIVDRSRPRDGGAGPLFAHVKKRDRAGSQHALLPKQCEDVVSVLREEAE